MPHLVLLCDSIFDNAQYASGGPDVVSQVRSLLPVGWAASLLAVDGSMTVNIPDQVRLVPKDCTYLVLSVGGNNALVEASRLGISPFGMIYNGCFPDQSFQRIASLALAIFNDVIIRVAVEQLS